MIIGWNRGSHLVRWLSRAAICAATAGLAGCQTPNAAKPRGDQLKQTRLEAALQLAEQHVAAGEFERARRVLAPFEASADPGVCVALARVDLEEGRYEAALQRVERVASVHVASPGAAGARLAADAQTAGPSGAADARFADRDAAAIGGVRALACAGLGRWSEAGAAAESAYRAAPDGDLLALWSEALVQQGRTDEALRTLEQERHRFAGDRALAQLAARLLAAKGDFGGVQREASGHAGDAALRQLLAEALTDAGRFGDALPHWQRLLADAESPSSSERGVTRRVAVLQRKVADCALRAMRYVDAAIAYRACIAAEPGDPAARLGLSAALLGSGAPQEALSVCEAVTARWPTYQDARLIAAACRHALGQSSEVLRLLEATAADDEIARALRARAAGSVSASAASIDLTSSSAAPE